MQPKFSCQLLRSKNINSEYLLAVDETPAKVPNKDPSHITIYQVDVQNISVGHTKPVNSILNSDISDR